MTTPGRAQLLSIALLALVATACTTTPVNQLAAATARNTSLLQTQLSTFVARQRLIADSRIANLSFVQQSAALAELRRDRDIAVEREVGLTDPLDLYKKLHDRAVESARQQAETQAAIAAARKSLEEKQKAVEVPTTALQDTAKSLLVVSEDLSFEGHVEFLYKFFSEVGKDVQKAQADAEKAKKSGDQKAKDATTATTDKAAAATAGADTKK
ncbi:MAG TPA: hypothetical protein VFE97_27550 [Methylomirabilota bacterium]|nr:hypothetical protein [Methylomirabilota bacterium]